MEARDGRPKTSSTNVQDTTSQNILGSSKMMRYLLLCLVRIFYMHTRQSTFSLRHVINHLILWGSKLDWGMVENKRQRFLRHELYNEMILQIKRGITDPKYEHKIISLPCTLGGSAGHGNREGITCETTMIYQKISH